MKKKITTTAAALALSAALLAGSTPKASAANVNRTPGAFGLYIAGAEVERVFTADDDLVYWMGRLARRYACLCNKRRDVSAGNHSSGKAGQRNSR